LTRHLVTRDARLAVAGNVRYRRPIEPLFDLVRARGAPRIGRERPLASYLSWPVYLDLDPDKRIEVEDIVEYHAIAPPGDLIAAMGLDPTRPLPAPTEEDGLRHRYIWARCLTAMRRAMIDACDVVVAMGGRRAGYRGKYPGIVEETSIALRAGKPLFLFGGFGGSTRAVIEAIRGRVPPGLDPAQPAWDRNEARFVEDYNLRAAGVEPDEPIDYRELCAFFAARGVQGLNNGLSAEENDRLFTTVYLEEAIFLLTVGLKRLFGSDRSKASPAGEDSRR
jgi:hypothetical protein